jgi:para-nitrobenzyl esterase
MAARPTAQIAAGGLVGRAARGVHVFHGIPFAAPPVGGLRWRPPHPPAPWAGLRDAGEPSLAPAQLPSPQVPPFATSEDCLGLSVWTPADAGDGPLPVLLWIYGGGFEGGLAVSPMTDPSRLVAEQRVVVVAANHRVGALGFAQLDHRGRRFAEATNLGLQDVLAALAWVGANAPAFGGDPGRVTVMGHSSGAFQAAALLAMPQAAGLFHRLALFSGGASRLVPLDAARAIGDRVLDTLARELGTSDPDALAGAPVAAILAAQQAGPARDIGRRNGPVPNAFGVVLDGGVVADHPMAAVEHGRARHVDLLVGTTSQEVAGLRGADWLAPAEYADVEAELVGWGLRASAAARIVGHYRAGRDPDATREALLTDYVYRLPAARLAAAHAAAGGRGWLVELAPCPSVGPRAPHGMETALVLGSHLDPVAARVAGYPPGRDETRERLSAALRARLGAFVRDGDPGWPPAVGAQPVLVAADDELAVAPARYAAALRVWEGVDRP